MGVGKVDCLNMLGVNVTGYYNWENGTQKAGGRRYELAKEDAEIKLLFLKIVGKISYVPGARTFAVFLYRDYGMTVSVERCGRLMKECCLIPHNGKPPKRKGKKVIEGRCHPCAAAENLVNRRFYQRARKVILTDITYLYIREYSIVIYLCVFYDAFTKEALGWAVQRHMTVELVREAFDMMMEKHGKELRGAEVLIHSDNGAQYASTTFRRILSDNEFIQSMSERGNSQDNAPMESFFGRMKSRIINRIALCPDMETARDTIDGYMNNYNSVIYQPNLAGLTPAEFYKFSQTGEYPLGKYFGVDASRFDDPQKLMDAIRELGEKHNEDEREAYARRRSLARKLLRETPEDIILADRKQLNKVIALQEVREKDAHNRAEWARKVLEKTDKALKFIQNAARDVLEELKDPLKWKEYPQLCYVFDMNGMY